MTCSCRSSNFFNKTANIIKTKLKPVSLTCKSHSFKTAKIKNPQILSTETSFYIYDWALTGINVIASFCA